MNLLSKQEGKLVNGCRANKRDAQEALYKLYYEDMLRLCFRYLRSDELANEALNIGFLKVFQQINTFESGKGTLGAWIRTIVLRSCIDLSRKEARFNHDIVEESFEDVFIQPAVLDKLYAEDLLKLIRQLPVATQLVFNLSILDGYSHKEIAEQLEITEGTSRWHLSEGKKQLRRLLNGIIDNPLKIKRS